MKRSFLYTLKVWLTIIVLPPIISAIILAFTSTEGLLSNLIVFIAWGFPVFLISALFFLFTCALLLKFKWNIIVTKIILSVLSFLYGFFPLAIVTGITMGLVIDPNMFYCYCVMFIASVWLFKIKPHRIPTTPNIEIAL